jgi:toxin ParE1/3/4
MSRYKFTPQARQDLKQINRYIAGENPEASKRFQALVKQKCQMVARYPEIGRSYSELAANLRGIVVQKYIIFYRPILDGIEIYRVISGYRDLESIFQEPDEL